MEAFVRLHALVIEQMSVKYLHLQYSLEIPAVTCGDKLCNFLSWERH